MQPMSLVIAFQGRSPLAIRGVGPVLVLIPLLCLALAAYAIEDAGSMAVVNGVVVWLREHEIRAALTYALIAVCTVALVLGWRQGAGLSNEGRRSPRAMTPMSVAEPWGAGVRALVQASVRPPYGSRTGPKAAPGSPVVGWPEVDRSAWHLPPASPSQAGEDDLRETREAALRTIEREVGRISRLTGDLALLALVDQKPRLDREPVDLVRIAKAEARRVRRAAPGLQIQVHAVELASAPGHGETLSHVVRNLVQDAANRTAPGGRVTLTCAVEESWIALTVQSSSVVAADGATSAESGSLGAYSDVNGLAADPGSLAVVRAIVERYHGSVEAANEDGQSKTVTLRLPRQLAAV